MHCIAARHGQSHAQREGAGARALFTHTVKFGQARYGRRNKARSQVCGGGEGRGLEGKEGGRSRKERVKKREGLAVMLR